MHKKSLTLIEVLVVIVIFAVLVFLLLPRHHSVRESALRSICAINLRQIGVAIHEYSNNYNDRFPCVSPPVGSIVGSPYKQGIDILDGEENAGALISQGIKDRTVSMNLWLLVRGHFVTPEVFQCVSSNEADDHVNLTDKDGVRTGPQCFTDFPFADDGSVSYSFIQPWTVWSGTDAKGNKHGSYQMWTADIAPEIVIGGDQNDGKDPATMNPTPKQMGKLVNSQNHDGDGQNLLSVDGHVSFYPTPYVGVEKDNVYTAMPGDYTGDPGSTGGILSVKPRNQFDPKINKPRQWDTVLIPVDSTNLKDWTPKP